MQGPIWSREDRIGGIEGAIIVVVAVVVVVVIIIIIIIIIVTITFFDLGVWVNVYNVYEPFLK